MRGERHPTRVVLTEARELTLERLSEAFAKDELDVDELEQRVDQAYQATTEEQLGALVVDLSPHVPAPNALVVDARASAPPAQHLRVLLGNVERRGRYRVPKVLRVSSVLGNVELDLRDAALDDGITELRVRAFLGNVELLVPPDLAIECEGSGILASFASVNRLPPEGDYAGPVLRIVGSAMLGNVEIRTLPRGVPSSREHAPALASKRSGS